MLSIECPKCQYVMKLTKFKAGKFTPTCKKCSNKFQLLIKPNGEGGFRSKTGPMPKSKMPASGTSPKPGASPTTTKHDAAVGDATRVDSPSTNSNVENANPSRAVKSAEITSKKLTGLSDSSDFKMAMQADTEIAPPPRPEQTQVEKGNPKKTKTGDTKVANHRTATSAKNPPAVGQLGPYRLLSLLGQGGMGAVYLANQTSLDRQVALKVVKANLAKSPAMLARFTREAYAAAQLVHPNVVQIYDMGDDKGNCYFSMELVDGESLSDLVKKKHDKLDPQQAASYILHAAKGLQCAHNAGMVHRDIKPANLLVGKDGIVKVADLGLVKVPDVEEIEDDVNKASALSASMDLTRWGSALGTPYYMAPEQARSAMMVDHRADIYSLGCTFYVLLTGKRPFDGDSFEEVVSKHNSQPIVLPSQIVARVPESLSAIVGKMMEKNPDNRYANIGLLIDELENFLGVSNTSQFTPDEKDADLLEDCAHRFNNAGLAKLRSLIPLAVSTGCLLLAVVMMFINWRWATGFLVLPVVAAISYFITSGMLVGSPLFYKVRELVIRGGVLSWLKWSAGLLLLALATLLIGAWPWILLGIVGIGLGVGYYFGVDVPTAAKRRPSIKDSAQLLRRMRLNGMDEPTLQTFVAKYCGSNWEEFFESHFGYAAKRRVRDELKNVDMGTRRPKFRVWRDRFCDSIDQRLEEFQTSSEQKHLQKIETAGLQAQGVTLAEAKEQAAQIANALIDHGDSIRVAQLEKQLAALDPEVQRKNQREKVKAMLAEAKSGKYVRKQSVIQRMGPKLNALAGSYVRFLVGCCLIVGCLMWARQNNLFSMEQISQTATQAKTLLESATDQTAVTEQAKAGAQQLNNSLNVETKPLAFPIVGLLFHDFNSLIAGLILILSAIVFGWRMTLFALPAAVITMWGVAFGIPDILQIKTVHVLSALIGIGILVLGIVFGRSEA